jgi:NitT/TauT family transport system substrate-binding protein
MLITGKTKVKEALDAYPQLRAVLIKMSPKFNKLNNPLFFKTVARWATFNDVSKMGGLSICSILHSLNTEIGQEDELFRLFPDCIQETKLEHEAGPDVSGPQFSKIIPFDTREREDYFLPELVEKVKKLDKEQALKIISDFDPLPLKKMLDSMGYSHFTGELNENLFETFIYSAEGIKEEKKITPKNGKIPVVIQSATPVTYPIILRMLESEKIKKAFEISELKVWRETEKHLGWIVNDKADISFSALMSSAKLYNKGKNLKMPAMVVWDNFKVLTRGYRASTFEDLKGRKIHTPLFKNAPPAAITKYLMEKNGYNPDDFEFVFGNPFGRPEEIKDCFVSGNCDTVILREPEASFALYEAGDDAFTSIDYGKLWRDMHPGSGNLPNAGLLFKGEFVKEHPDLANLFLNELESAVNWVKANPKSAGILSAEAMNIKAAEVEFFLGRATLDFKKSADVQDELKVYLDVLKKEELLKTEDIDKTMGLFEW